MRVFKNGAPAGDAYGLDLREGTSGIVLTVADEPANGTTSVTFNSVPSLVGNRIAAIGDSLTSGGYTASGAMPYASTQANAYLMWGCILSQGWLVFKGSFGGSGFTTAQILATNVPLALASGANVCVVLGGTNDVGTGVSLATSFTNLSAIYSQLEVAGKTPIACTIPPRNGDSAAQVKQLTQLNAWIERNATNTGLPFIDFYSWVTDPATGNWISGYNLDLIHPSNAGAKRIGQILSDSLAGTSYLSGAPTLLPAAAATWLPINNVDTANLLTNGLMMTDSGAPVGRPTGWSQLSGAAANEATVTDPQFFGKVYQHTGIAQMGVSSSAGVAVAGDLVYMVARIGSVVEAAGGNASFAFTDTGGSQSFLVLSGWDKDIPPGSVLAYEFTMPATGNQRFRFSTTHGVNAAVQTSVGQVGALNLTAAGIS